MMANVFDFAKLRRLITIYAVVQGGLVLLLVFVAMGLQGGLAAVGRGDLFMKSIVATLAIQAAMFYPIYKFSTREAGLAIESMRQGLAADDLKALRNKRLMGDVIKVGIFCFFLIFIVTASSKTMQPTAMKFVLSLIYFNFILTYLSYFQCFNFVAKREMKAKAG
jgi:hypothetical protein